MHFFFHKPLQIFLIKDYKTEISLRKIIIVFSTVLILVFLSEIVVQSAFISPESRESLLIPFVWLTFFISQLFQAPNQFGPEREEQVNQGINLTGISLNMVFFSKVIVYSLLNIVLLVLVFLLTEFFWANQAISIINVAEIILLIGIPIVVASTSIVILLAATLIADDRSPLLNPITVVPLLVPLFVLAIEFSYNIELKRDVLLSSAILCFLTLFYLILSLLLFPVIFSQQSGVD